MQDNYDVNEIEDGIMRIDETTFIYDSTYVTWKDMEGTQYRYTANNIQWAATRGGNGIHIIREAGTNNEYMSLLPDASEYLSYIWRSKEAHIKDPENICLSFQEEIRDHILDENGNIYFVAGSKIYFYRRKKKLLEKINEIPAEYYFQRIEELDNKELMLVCSPEAVEKFGGRDCRIGMDRNSKRWKEYGLTY